MPSASFNEVFERTRLLINAAAENIYKAKVLCELAGELRYDNADFRDFLRDMRVATQSMSQRRKEEKSAFAALPDRRKAFP